MRRTLLTTLSVSTCISDTRRRRSMHGAAPMLAGRATELERPSVRCALVVDRILRAAGGMPCRGRRDARSRPTV